jgi:NADPH:quinone reductase-like Zn-dependent oxidoreductase
VTHFALNPADVKLMPMSLACRASATHACPLGLEGSGIVRRSASAVHAVGARVFFGAMGCSRGRLLRLRDVLAGAVPKHWSLQSAAAMTIAFSTGLTGLRRCGPFDSRSAALVVGGGTVTGAAMLQLLRAGRRVDRAVASCGNASACLAAGADDVISRHSETLAEGAARLKLRGVALVYEATLDPSAWPLAQQLGAQCFVAIDLGVDTAAPLPQLLLATASVIWRVVSRTAYRWVAGGPKYEMFMRVRHFFLFVCLFSLTVLRAIRRRTPSSWRV